MGKRARRQERRQALQEPFPTYVALTTGQTKAGNLFIQVPDASTLPAGYSVEDGYKCLVEMECSESGHGFHSYFKVYETAGVSWFMCPICEQHKKRLFCSSFGQYRWKCGSCLNSGELHIIGKVLTPNFQDSDWDTPADAAWFADYYLRQRIVSDRAWIAKQMAKAAKIGNDQRRTARIAKLEALTAQINALTAQLKEEQTPETGIIETRGA